MNQRYGAWAQLLVLFRLFHDGAETDGLQLPPRHGDLFNPDRFPFLEPCDEARRARDPSNCETKRSERPSAAWPITFD